MSSNKQPNFPLHTKETNESRIEQKEEKAKIRAEINKIDTKKTQEKINKLRVLFCFFFLRTMELTNLKQN